MKQSLIKVAPLWLDVLFSMFFLFTVAACHKDPKPEVFGTWETVSAVGFKWEYTITRDAQFCKRLPEYFPDTSFCFDYEVDANGTVVDVDAPNAENWTWEFMAEDLADVVVRYADSTSERIIIKRLK